MDNPDTTRDNFGQFAGSSNGNSGCQGVECCQAAESDCASDGYSESEAMGKTK
jgi:hypothetical protein